MTFTSYDLAGPDPKPMSVAELDALKDIVKLLPVRPLIVQIGAERGVSTLGMLEADPKAVILSIDMGERPEEYENLKKAGYNWKRVVRLLGKSQHIGMYLPDYLQADLLYIDGDHRYDGVTGDIKLWLRCVKQGGYVAFHDYIKPEERAPHIQGRVWEAMRDHFPFSLYDQVSIVERLIVFRNPELLVAVDD